MTDAGEIKAKIIVTYDGSGVEKAKEDIAKLAESAGALEEGAKQGSDGLAGFEEQANKTAKSTEALNSSVTAMEKPLERSGNAVVGATEVMQEHQTALEETKTGYEDLQKPMLQTTAMLQNVSPPMLAISDHAQSMVEQLAPVNESFAQLGESLTQSVPMLPQFAENLHSVSESFDPHAFGLQDFTENMAVFQDALSNPYPFSMVQQHLNETGQTWDDFTSSIGEDNTQMLHDMATSADVSHKSFGNMASDVQSVGTVFHESAGETEAFTKQFNGLNESATNAGKAMAETGNVAADAGKAVESVGGFGDTLSSTMSGMSEFFGGIAMPAMMAMQMIIPMVTQVAQGIYDMAAIAEGPAAHSMGTFTGQVDALGQTSQRVAGQFSESFGQQVIPTLDAMNYQMAQSGGLGQDVGGQLGAISSFFVNWGETIEGPALMMNPATFGLGLDMTKAGFAGMINQGASALGLPEPFQGPAVQGQNPMQGQISQMYALANNPEYLAAQAYYQSAAGKAMRNQAAWDVSHYAGSTGPMDPMNQVFQAQAAMQNGGSYGSFQDPNLAWLNNLGYTESLTGGCFIAGTPVQMADGTEKPIEALQIGERVLAHDGEKQVVTTVLARIVPPPKKVYVLVFSDGAFLKITDSHPVSTLDGWKSISPEATSLENPNLEVSPLQIGDIIHTLNGTCRLADVYPLPGIVQVYNITVDAPHTFYANNVLVHNKTLGAQIGPQISEQIGSIQLPHIDLSGMASQLTGAFSGISLPHIDLSGLSSIFSGISLPPIPDIGGEINGAMSSMFGGISLPAIPNIGGMLNGALGSALGAISLPAIPDIGGMLSGALSGAIGAISMPPIPDIGGMLSGALSGAFGGISLPSVPDVGGMIDGAMSGMFGGIQVPSVPDIGGMINGAMSGMFGGITIPSVPNLGAQISSAMSGMFSGISMPSIPFFAQGVQNYTGLGIVGEAGPELVSLNGGSVFPLSAGPGVGGGMSPLSFGGGGGDIMISITHVTQLDGRTIMKESTQHLATAARQLTGGKR